MWDWKKGPQEPYFSPVIKVGCFMIDKMISGSGFPSEECHALIELFLDVSPLSPPTVPASKLIYSHEPHW